MFTLVSSITAEGSVGWSSCQVLHPAMQTSVTGHGGDQGRAKRSIPELNYCAAEICGRKTLSGYKVKAQLLNFFFL